MPSPKVYLVYFEQPRVGIDKLRDELDAAVLRDGLWLVETDATRSRLYHDVKHRLKADAALLVVELDRPPKMKGMAAGTTAWVRERF